MLGIGFLDSLLAISRDIVDTNIVSKEVGTVAEGLMLKVLSRLVMIGLRLHLCMMVSSRKGFLYESIFSWMYFFCVHIFDVRYRQNALSMRINQYLLT